MERSEVSRHEVSVYRVLAAAGTSWLSNNEVAEQAGVSPRTARAHTLKLVRRGIAEQAEVFPGHRYRISEFAEQHDHEYVGRLHRAAEALGIHMESM